MKTAFIICFVLILSSLKTWADIRDDFLESGLKIPRALGGATIGGLDLNNLMAQMPSVPVRAARPGEVSRKNNDGRTSAHFDGHSILVNRPDWNFRTAQQSVIALHEYFRALGYAAADNDYRLSLNLFTLATHGDRLSADRRAYLIRMIETSARVRKADGGVVGVGGGGESGTIWARQREIERALDSSDDEFASAVESNATVAYYNPKRIYKNGIRGGIWKPSKSDARSARCLVSGGTCPARSRGLPSESCSCNGVAGITIFNYKVNGIAVTDPGFSSK